MNRNGAYVRTYAIIGAGGRIGSQVVKNLLAKGHKVHAIDISEGRIRNLAPLGAKLFVGSFFDPVFLQKPFTHVDAAFTLIPQMRYSDDYLSFQERASFAIAKGIRLSGIQQVVNLSILSADVSSAPKTFKKLHEFELLLEGIPGLNVAHLRATYFMDNLLLGLKTISQAKMYGLPLHPDLSIPFIAIEDVAQVASDILGELNLKGTSVVNLFGQRNLTMEEVTEILRHKLNIPDLLYLYMPYADAYRSLVRSGWSENLAEHNIEIFSKINERIVISNVIRRKSGTTSTSIEEFIDKNILPGFVRSGIGNPI